MSNALNLMLRFVWETLMLRSGRKWELGLIWVNTAYIPLVMITVNDS